jgi:hypothetical protein
VRGRVGEGGSRLLRKKREKLIPLSNRSFHTPDHNLHTVTNSDRKGGGGRALAAYTVEPVGYRIEHNENE